MVNVLGKIAESNGHTLAQNVLFCPILVSELEENNVTIFLITYANHKESSKNFDQRRYLIESYFSHSTLPTSSGINDNVTMVRDSSTANLI